MDNDKTITKQDAIDFIPESEEVATAISADGHFIWTLKTKSELIEKIKAAPSSIIRRKQRDYGDCVVFEVECDFKDWNNFWYICPQMNKKVLADNWIGVF